MKFECVRVGFFSSIMPLVSIETMNFDMYANGQGAKGFYLT